MEPMTTPMGPGNKVKSVKIETPIGTVESDSDNHLVDIGTVVVIILLFFAMKKFFQAT